MSSELESARAMVVTVNLDLLTPMVLVVTLTFADMI
jgi:hypothetical protein